MKILLLSLISLVSLNTFAGSVVTINPMIEGMQHTDKEWGAINYYAKRLADNTYIRINDSNKVVLFEEGEYEIGGISAHNICYSSRETILIKDNQAYEVILDVVCE